MKKSQASIVVRLSSEELAPSVGPRRRWRGLDAVPAQDRPDARRQRAARPWWPARRGSADTPRWGSPSPGEAPARPCPRAAPGRPDRSAGVRPSATHQISMPPQQGLGPDEEPSPTLSPEEPAQPGEQRSVGWPECGACDLAAQNRDLVSEHDDFDGQFLPLASGIAGTAGARERRPRRERRAPQPILAHSLILAKVQVKGSGRGSRHPQSLSHKTS